MTERLEIVIAAKEEFAAAFRSLSGAISTAARGMAIAGGAAAALGAGIFALAKATAAEQDELSKFSDKLGLSVEGLSKLKYAGQLADVSLESMGQSLQLMLRYTAEAAAGNEDYRDTIRRLGIEFESIKAQSPDEIFRSYAAALSGVENPAERVSIAMQVFGRSGAEMLKVLKDGTKGLDEMAAEASRFGVVVSSQAAYNAAEFNDSITRIGTALTGVRNELAEKFLPYLTGLFKNLAFWIADNRKNIVDWAITFVQALGRATETVVKFGARAVDTFYTINAGLAKLQIAENAGYIKALISQAEDYEYQIADAQRRLAELQGMKNPFDATAVMPLQDRLVGLQESLENVKNKILAINNENQVMAEQFSQDSSKMFNADAAQAFFDKIKAGLEDLRQAGTAEIKTPKKSTELPDDLTSQQKAQLNEMKQMWLEYYGTEREQIDEWYRYAVEKYRGLKDAQAMLDDVYQAKQLGVVQKRKDGEEDYIKSIENSTDHRYKLLEERRISDTDRANIWYQEQLELHGASEDARSTIEFEYTKKRQEAAQSDHDYQLGLMADKLNVTGNMLGSMASLAASFGKKGFRLYQLLAIGEAHMSMAAGITRAFKDYAYPWSIVVAAMVGAACTAQIASIAMQKPPEAHTGLDFVPQERTYLLSKGERVVQPQANKDLTEFLQGGAHGGGGAQIENLHIEVFPNVTDARALRNIDDREMEEILEERIIPAMRRLKFAGITA